MEGGPRFLTWEEKMLANLRSFVVAGLVGAGLLGLAGAAHGQSYQHIHKLSIKLEKQLKELHAEVDAHFKPTPQHAHLHKHVTRMQKLAGHIHHVIDEKGGVAHVRADVKELD
jgi:hypothetical protein